LYPDSIRVSGNTRLAKFDTTIRLGTLEPNFERIWFHQNSAYIFGLLFVVGLVALWVLAVGLNRGLSDPLSVAAGAFALTSFLFALVAGQRIELVRFRSHAGVPLLDVARAGKRKSEFDGFVSTLAERVAAENVTP
jgi:hypothetical protein